MPEDVAVVMDTAIDTSAVDTTQVADQTADTGTDATEVIDNADSPQAGETGHLRGSDLYRAVKDKLKAGEKLSSQELRSIRNAIHIAGQADKATGGDLTKFEAERNAYAQLAGPDEEGYTPEQIVESVRADRDQLNGILQDIEAGAPKLIEEMFTDHPEVFKSLVPQAMDKLAQLDNDRFSNYIARCADSYFTSAQIPVQFAILDTFLPQSSQDPGTQRVIDAVNAIKQAFSGIQQMAQKKIDPAQIGNRGNQAQNGNQNADLDQREMRVTLFEWNRSAGQPNVQLRDSEMARIAAGRKMTLTPQETAEISAAVKDEFEARLAANRNYGQTMQGYIKAKNQRAYNDRAASEGKKLLPSIVDRHTNAVLNKRTAQATTKTAAKSNGAVQQTKDASGNLIQWLSGSPKSLGKQVDYMRTSNSMLQRNEAYLKGEKALFKWKERTV